MSLWILFLLTWKHPRSHADMYLHSDSSILTLNIGKLQYKMKLFLCIMSLSKCKAFYFSCVFVHVHNLCLMDKKILLFLMKKLATSYQHTFTIKHSVRSENTPRPPFIYSLSDGLFNSTVVEYAVYVSAVKVFSYFWVNFINTSVSRPVSSSLKNWRVLVPIVILWVSYL